MAITHVDFRKLNILAGTAPWLSRPIVVLSGIRTGLSGFEVLTWSPTLATTAGTTGTTCTTGTTEAGLRPCGTAIIASPIVRTRPTSTACPLGEVAPATVVSRHVRVITTNE